MNPDLQNERRKATFNVEALTYVIEGGEAFTQRRREIGITFNHIYTYIRPRRPYF